MVWGEGPNASESSATIAERLKEGLTAPVAYAGNQNGEALKAIADAPSRVEAVYTTPFLAHATMEPMNCTARVSDDIAEMWVPTQNGEASLAALSEASGVSLDKCEDAKSTRWTLAAASAVVARRRISCAKQWRSPSKYREFRSS
jgi:isoquinoline 1-oxidoreductase beta subunit